jgi:hypothetical protein
MTITFSRILTLVLSGLMIAGCVRLPVEPVSPRLPEPVEIHLVTPESRQVLARGDEGFAPVVADLPVVLNSIATQARTLFSPERFTEEVELISHIYLRFEDDSEFAGQGIRWRASELVIAAPGGEFMLLARASDADDWSVYLPDDPTILQDFMSELVNY